MKKEVYKSKTLYQQDNGSLSITIKITLAIEIGITIISNCIINALCAWLLNKNAVVIATNGMSVFIDLCITCFLICLCTTPFSATAARRYQKTGLLTEWKPKTKLLSHYPKKTILLALSFAFSVMLPLGMIFGIVFSSLGLTELTVFSYILYKGALGGIIGGFVCAFTLARYQF